MRFEGVLPEDAPDPRIEQAKRLELIPVPIVGLVPQPSLEDADMIGISYGHDDAGYSEMSASITYTLWRNPEDRSDPRNLAELDEQMRTAIETTPPWPRPAWLVQQVERMRYPQLWEAVRTTWHRDPSERSSPARLLVDHVNYILMNRYRRESRFGANVPGAPAPVVTGRSVNSGITVWVDGVEIRAVEIDTDPFVYGVGASLERGGIVTAVLPRDELEYIQVEFASRPQPPGGTRASNEP